MPNAIIDNELDAIKSIIAALEPLERESRLRSLEYAIEHLGLGGLTNRQRASGEGSRGGRDFGKEAEAQYQGTKVGDIVTDIRSFKEKKCPATAIEMATLVAYFLKHEAGEGERKDSIGTDDIEKYFVQAQFPLPNDKASTLPNAKKAGYLESAGHGKYKLNSVGHNLIVHGMPKSDSTPQVTSKRMRGKKKTNSRKKRKN